MKVNLVVKASKGVIVEGYAFKDSGDADDKADDMRNSREFNENDDDVCVIYDVPLQEAASKTRNHKLEGINHE